jgi:hypothetical protein
MSTRRGALFVPNTRSRQSHWCARHEHGDHTPRSGPPRKGTSGRWAGSIRAVRQDARSGPDGTRRMSPPCSLGGPRAPMWPHAGRAVRNVRRSCSPRPRTEAESQRRRAIAQCVEEHLLSLRGDIHRAVGDRATAVAGVIPVEITSDPIARTLFPSMLIRCAPQE